MRLGVLGTWRIFIGKVLLVPRKKRGPGALLPEKCTRSVGVWSQKLYTFAEDYGETTVLKREAGEKPELCPQRYVL